MTAKVTDNASAKRFEITADGELAGYLAYVRDNGRIVLAHTEIYDGFRGRGLADELVGDAIRSSSRDGLAIEPHCSFVAAYLERERANVGRDVSLTGIPHVGRATVVGAL